MIREMIGILSVCDDWDFGARFRCSFNRNDGRSLGQLTNEESALSSLLREFVTLRVQIQGTFKIVDDSFGIL